MKNGYYKDKIGNQYWSNNGTLHREDGPAVIWSNGGQEWYINGERHREDGPAYIGLNGTQEWYINGERHREDGPAVIHSDGSKSWYVNDIDITDKVDQWFEDFNFTYDTMEFEDKMALKFYIRGLVTEKY